MTNRFNAEDPVEGLFTADSFAIEVGVGEVNLGDLMGFLATLAHPGSSMGGSFFRDQMLREQKRREGHLFEATKALGDYCVSESIDDVVLLDRSARPTWNALWQYLSLAHPEEQKPAIHFMNPTHLELPDNTSFWTRGLEQRRQNKAIRVASEELVATNGRLGANQGSPVLLFDTCSHSGNTLRNASRVLEGAGLQDIRTGVFTSSGLGMFEQNLDLDFSFTSDQSVLGCHPFEVDEALMPKQGIYSAVLPWAYFAMDRSYARSADRQIISREFFARNED